jgi:hypothetical protein
MTRPEQHSKWNLKGQLQIKICAKVLPASAMKTPLISLKEAHSTSAAAEKKQSKMLPNDKLHRYNRKIKTKTVQ